MGGAGAVALSPNIARARAAMARAMGGDLGSGGPAAAARPASASAPKAKAAKAKPAAAAAKTPASAAAAAAPYEAPRAAESRAAVLAAAAALPSSPSQLEYSVMEEAAAAGGGAGGGTGVAPGQGRADDAPPNAGAVAPPQPGHPDAFKGLTFVISGVLDSLHREEAASHIQRHGGRVTGSVSGKTSFLLVGHNAGRSKTAGAARQPNCKMIDEKGLRKLIAASVPFKPAAEEEEEVEEVPLPPAAGAAPAERKQSGCPSAAAAPAAPAPPPPQPLLPLPPPPPAAAAAAPPPTAPGAAPAVTGNRGSDLWVDKHRPLRSSELVGNPGVIGHARQWLVMWYEVFFLLAIGNGYVFCLFLVQLVFATLSPVIYDRTGGRVLAAGLDESRGGIVTRRCHGQKEEPRASGRGNGVVADAWRRSRPAGKGQKPAVAPLGPEVKEASKAVSGHSHWSKIKRAKGDHRRASAGCCGASWRGGSSWRPARRRQARGEPVAAVRHRRGRAANMPNDTIDQAIKKGTGELGAENYETVMYEGYGPGGVAFMVECLTEQSPADRAGTAD